MLPFPLTGSWASSSSPEEEEEEVLVSYILLAEFDLTTGSTLRHQFPKPVPNYEPDFFAEKMLPEGAHNRETDTTFFLLNPQSPTPDELVEQALQRQQVGETRCLRWQCRGCLSCHYDGHMSS